MDRMLTIMGKEFQHIWRDPRTMALIVLLPALLLVLLGFGISGQSRDVPLAVVDLSRSDASRALVDRFTVSRDFAVAYQPQNEDELLTLMDRDQVKGGLIIPPDFGAAVATGRTTAIQLYVNGSADPTQVQTVELKLNSIAQAADQEILIDKVVRMGGASSLSLPFDVHSRLLYNPDSDAKRYMIPGLIPIILQVQALLLTALAIVKEREHGTMEQLIVTPIRSWELMGGKILPYLLVSMVNTVVLVIMGGWIFGVQVTGSWLELFGLSAVFILGSLGMGVLISNVSQSQMQAVYLSVFVVIIPAIILSGLLLPRDNMPAVTYWFSELMPVTHYLTITRGIMLKGISARYLWSSVWPLVVLSVVYFVASVLAFRKRI